MLKLERIRLSPGGGEAELVSRAAKLLRIREADIRSVQILRRSVDARETAALIYTLAVSVDNEAAVLRRCRGQNVSRLEPGQAYCPPAPAPPPETPPVIVGAGPAGLSCFRQRPPGGGCPGWIC